MKDFTVWVDADSCPQQVKQIIFRFCSRLELKLVFVANRSIPMPENPNFSLVVCEATSDAADDYIVDHCTCDDIIVTRDIPLASRLLEKNSTAINDRGLLFTQENIREKLSIRNFNKELYENGILSEKTSTFSKKDLNNFSNCFDREIQKKLRK